MVNPESMDVDQTLKIRAVHRVVRAMNDGACPHCGWMGDRDAFDTRGFSGIEGGHLQCPSCEFLVTAEDMKQAQKQFLSVMHGSLKVFIEWKLNGYGHKETRSGGSG